MRSPVRLHIKAKKYAVHLSDEPRRCTFPMNCLCSTCGLTLIPDGWSAMGKQSRNRQHLARGPETGFEEIGAASSVPVPRISSNRTSGESARFHLVGFAVRAQDPGSVRDFSQPAFRRSSKDVRRQRKRLAFGMNSRRITAFPTS
jgi:hypothetical protein